MLDILLNRKICTTFLIIIFLNFKLFSQSWPPPYLSSISLPWSDGHHNYLAKVKYSPNGKNYFALYNYHYFGTPVSQPNANDIGVDGIKRGARIKYQNYGQTIEEKGYHGIYGGYGSYGIDFESDTEKNIYFLGESYSLDSGQITLLKKDYSSNTIWSKTLGGSKTEQAYAIKWAGDGNLIALLQTESSDGDITGYNGGKDIWLVKINPTNGNIIWKKTYGSSANEIPSDMEILPDQSILIAGAAENSAFLPSAYANTNCFVMKLDELGNIIWKKNFGGDGSDSVKSITLINDGGFVTSGISTSANGDMISNAGGTDVFVFKHNAFGDIIWKKFYGNTNNDEACDVIYKPCDSMIIVSYAKQFSNNTYNPFYPLYSQLTGVQVGIYNNGTQFFYQENDFAYPSYYGSTGLNRSVFNTMASANKESVLLGMCSEDLIYWDNFPPFPKFVARSSTVNEYGIKLNIKFIDTTICAGQTVWGNTFFIDTTFSDTLRNVCLSDTLINNYSIHIKNADSTISKDTIVCYGQPYKGISVFNSFNSTDTSILNTNCGPRRLIIKTKVTVTPEINIDLGQDKSLCNINNLLLSVSHPLSTYLWQDNSKLSTYSATSSGLYWVQVTDTAGCKKRDSINLIFENIFLTINRNLYVIPGEQVLLNPQTNGTITWVPNSVLSCFNCQSTTARINTPTTIYLSSTKNNCTLFDSIKISLKNNPCSFYVPNAFTPNNDGKNDCIKAFVFGNIKTFIFHIYNRYGQEVFYSNNPLECWNGKFKNLEQDIGNYVYYLKLENECGTHSKKGNIILIR
jgi:gliding motility-associated-like protein